MFLQNDINEYNRKVEAWKEKARNAVLAAIASEGVVHRKNSPDKIALKNSVKATTKKEADVTSRVTFSFNRSMVFLQKGVSRGHPISNPRKAKDVFNGPVNKHFDELADLAADMMGEMIVNALLIK